MALVFEPARAVVRQRWDSNWPVLVTLLLGLLTTLPYVYAASITQTGRVYTGMMLDAPDTLQYFSWMRDHRTAWLVPNRMTSQPNDPALFNLLWLALAQLQNLTGWNNSVIFQLLRLLGGISFLGVAWWFYGLTACSRGEQGWAWLIATGGGGLGVIWVIEKYVRGLPAVRYPFDLYVAEPNTLLSLLGYPHFLVAGALMVAIFGAALLAVRGNWNWWFLAAFAGLVLALQHAYDLLTIYAVLAVWIALLALRMRAIPWRTVVGATLVGIVSFPPAGYFAWLTSRDPFWQAVLSQFSNAGVWTPNLLHLPILMGLPLIVAVLGWDGLRGLNRRSEGELLVKAWAIAGLGLIYLPVSFQIHLLNPLQIPLALVAVWGLQRRLAPWLARRSKRGAALLLPLLLALSLPTNVYLLAWRFVELSRQEAPYFLHRDESAALNWLAASTSRDDVVLSDLNLGQYVASDTDARAVLAHWAQTIDFYRTRDDVARVLTPTTSTSERHSLLRQYHVSHVLATSEIKDSALIPVWSSPQVFIYAVQLPGSES